MSINQPVKVKLDWARLLGFDQVAPTTNEADSPRLAASRPAKFGAKFGGKTGLRILPSSNH